MATGGAATSRIGQVVLACLPIAVATGCAGGARHAALDSAPSSCAQQYRQYDEQAPAPSHLSKEERARYAERTRDYHVSQRCQQEGGQGGVLWTSHPVDPVKPDFRGKRGD